jgi:hypothetical protein
LDLHILANLLIKWDILARYSVLILKVLPQYFVLSISGGSVSIMEWYLYFRTDLARMFHESPAATAESLAPLYKANLVVVSWEPLCHVVMSISFCLYQ